MRYLLCDTNVLVRLIRRDDPRQVAVADRFVEKSVWVSLLALAEITWVLVSVYDRRPLDILVAIEMLLNHQLVVMQDRAQAGHLPLGTFDHTLGTLDGAEKL